VAVEETIDEQEREKS